MTAPDDPRAVLARLVVRLRAAAPPGRVALVKRMLPLLSGAAVPLTARYAAAASAIDALPDHPGAVRAVARSLTEGLSPAKRLARLRHLQNLTAGAQPLDELVARIERKVKISCPRCAVRLPRAEMAKHLWHEHRLELAGGTVRSVAQAVEALRLRHAATADPELIDRAAARAGGRVVGAWAAETATADEARPLLAAAGERQASLCPGCFGDVRPAVPELPPPLAVADGRVAGDGLAATVPPLAPPRVRATLLAAAVLLAFALGMPAAAGVVGMTAPAAGPVAVLLSAVAYLLGRVLFRARSAPDDMALDAAWKSLAPRLTDRRDAARFLARLCATSADRGDPFERANPLNALVARARAGRGEHRLLAVAMALQVDDAARFGRDRAAGMAALLRPAFAGARPADFAELALAMYFRTPRDSGELARLRVLLLADAFAAGLGPADVLALCDAAPHLARAVRLSPNHVAVLYGVWANRTSRPWARVGGAKTVFDLAAGAPATAARLLRAEPGLALVCDTDPAAEAELGPVLVSLGGVSVGGVTATDPAAEVRLDARGRSLVFGGHTLKVSGRLPDALPRALRAWLRFRSEVLGGYPAAYLGGAAPAAARLLGPFVAKCPACGTACLPAVGAVARPLPA